MTPNQSAIRMLSDFDGSKPNNLHIRSLLRACCGKLGLTPDQGMAPIRGGSI